MAAETTNLGNTAARGLIWTLLATIGGRVVTLISLALLARLLVPADFGLLALALTFITYVETVGDLGTGIALIYWPSREKEAAQVTFCVNLAMGFSWLALSYYLAPWVAGFFHSPAALPILRALAWSFPLKALGNTHDALSLKWMRFKLRLLPELGMASTKAVLSVLLAFSGYGVWSLVFGQLVGIAVWTLSLWTLIPWRPAARVPIDLVGPMLRYGRGIVAVNVLAAVLHHADLVVVARMLGAATLGFYQMAYKVPEMTVTLLMRTASKVLFPTFSKLQKDERLMWDAYLETLRYVSLMIVPASVGLFLLAEPIVLSLFGEVWRPAVPLLRALAVYAGARGLGTHSGDILKATGRPGLLAAIGVFKAILLVPVLVIAARTSALAVATALAGVASVGSIFNILLVCRLLSIPAREAFQKLFPGLVTGGAVTIVLVSVGDALQRMEPSFALLGGTLLGSVTVLVVVRLLQPELYGFLRTRLRLPGPSDQDANDWRPGDAPAQRVEQARQVPELVPFARFLVPIHDRDIVNYFLDNLLVPYTTWQRLTLPLAGRFGCWARKKWLAAAWWAGDREAPFVRGNGGHRVSRAQSETIRANFDVDLVARLLGNGKGSLTLESSLEERRPLRWMLLRDYESGHRNRSVVFVFGQQDLHPSAILKLRSHDGPGGSLCHEWNALRRVGSLAELDGSVPQPLAFHADTEFEALLISCLSGRSAYVEMHRAFLRRGRIADHFRMAAEWLARFHLATRRSGSSGEKSLNLEELVGLAPRGSVDVDRGWCERLWEAWHQTPFPMVASHGDYWARNILLDGEGCDMSVRQAQELPGVVDWEHYSAQTPFFLDLFHFPVTYGLNFPWNRQGKVDLEEALTRTFLEENIVSLEVRRYFGHYARRAGLEGSLVSDMFHIYLLNRLPEYRAEERAVWLRLHRALLSTDRSVFSG